MSQQKFWKTKLIIWQFLNGIDIRFSNWNQDLQHQSGEFIFHVWNGSHAISLSWPFLLCCGIFCIYIYFVSQVVFYPPASETSREVANLTERKNPHTSIYGVKECVCLSVCLLPNSTPITRFNQLVTQICLMCYVKLINGRLMRGL